MTARRDRKVPAIRPGIANQMFSFQLDRCRGRQQPCLGLQPVDRSAVAIPAEQGIERVFENLVAARSVE